MARDNVERRLSAILAADVVGYSRLMEADETGTLAALKSHRRELWTPMMAQHGGRLVGTAGDSLLVEFASAVAAVECAIAVQQGMDPRNAGLAESQRMLLRMGVNIGEVIVDGDDIFGDGVNIAARLEGLCEPGGVALSGNVQEQVDGKIDARFEDTGDHTVKNIARPVRVWRWLLDTAAAAEPPEPQKPPVRFAEKASIAVLPFTAMSSDPDHEHFADGITEDIITALARNHAFHVIARNSTFAYKGQSPDIRDVGRALGCGFVLEGSIRSGRDRVRITTQLIDADTGSHVWADRFDRPLDDEFAVQDEIAHRVASILGELVWQSVAKGIGQKDPKTYGPYEYTYLATPLVHHMDPAKMAQAQAYCLKALSLDPDFVVANRLLGFCLVIGWMLWDASSGEVLDECYEYTLRSQALAPEEAITYRLMSRVFVAKGMIDEARQCTARALKINPDDGDIIGNQGIFALFADDPKDAIGWFEKVLEIHSETPHTVDIMRCWMSLAHFVNGDCSLALATLKDVNGLDFFRNLLLAVCYAELGDPDKAKASVQVLLAARPQLRVSDVGLCTMFQRPEHRALLSNALAHAGLPA